MKRRISGIYSITNLLNGNRYFGSSASVWDRKRQHFHCLRKGIHRNKHLQAAWNKYGEVAFAFALVEEVCVDRLLRAEQAYLEANPGGYNISNCAESAALGIRWSDEAKRRVSASRIGRRLSEEHKLALSIANKGKRKTEAERIAMSRRQSGKPISTATKVKIASSIESLWKSVGYREMIVAAQRAGKDTAAAKRNYGAASSAMWSDPQYRNRMSVRRKALWADPAYREKMLKIRRAQGARLRQRNQEANQNALS